MKSITSFLAVFLAGAGCLATGAILGNPELRVPPSPAAVKRPYVAPDFEYYTEFARKQP